MDNKKIGKKIAIYRNKLNLTQTALAEKLCVSPKTVSKWESGNGLPSIELLPELAKLFGITIDELLYKETNTSSDSNLNEINALSMFRILSPNYSNFPDQVREMLKDEWLSFILKEEDLTIPEFYSLLNFHSKPKNIADCVDRLFSLEIVSISKIQKKLRIGFARAANIRESLIENSMVDGNSFSWLNKDCEKLTNILTKELKGVPLKDGLISTPNICKSIDINIDFKAIKLINDKLSKEEISKALSLLEECACDFNRPDSSAIFCFDRENLSNVLLSTNNCLNVNIFNLDCLDNFKNKVELPNSQYSFILIESDESANIIDLMSVCDARAPTEFALMLNNDLEDKYRFTIYYM